VCHSWSHKWHYAWQHRGARACARASGRALQWSVLETRRTAHIVKHERLQAPVAVELRQRPLFLHRWASLCAALRAQRARGRTTHARRRSVAACVCACVCTGYARGAGRGGHGVGGADQVRPVRQLILVEVRRRERPDERVHPELRRYNGYSEYSQRADKALTHTG
jgi:hypothetical protein